MAIAFVQQATNSANTGTTIVVTITAPAAGSLLVCLSAGSGTPHISSISGGGVTWVNATQTGFSANVDTWYGPNSSGSGTSITVTYNATLANGTNVNIQEYSGIVAVSPLDATHTANGGAGSTNPATGATATTKQSDELCVACAGLNTNSAVTAGPTNSFNALTSVSNTGRGLICAYEIVGAVGAFSTDWTVTTTSTWDAAIITFKGIVNVPDDDELASYPCAPMGGRIWSVPEPVKAQEDWTQRVILPSAAGIAQQMEDWQAHDVLGGRDWQTLSPARQIEEMTYWTQRVILPPLSRDDDFANRPPLAVWRQEEDEMDWANDVFTVIPAFDPTQINWPEQIDIPSPQSMKFWEDDSPLRIFLPPPGWDDDQQLSTPPLLSNLLDPDDRTVQIFIPLRAFDNDVDMQLPTPPLASSWQDPDDRTLRIVIPVAVWDDDWQMAVSPQMKLDDERDYQMRIFLPQQAWDDDWQMATAAMVKLEEVDSPLLVIIPAFDPMLVRDGEQIQLSWPQAMRLDDDRDYQMRIFLPQVGWDDDWQMAASRLWTLSVAPEGDWASSVVISVVTPPPDGVIPGVSRFRLHMGVRITRGF